MRAGFVPHLRREVFKALKGGNALRDGLSSARSSCSKAEVRAERRHAAKSSAPVAHTVKFFSVLLTKDATTRQGFRRKGSWLQVVAISRP